MRSSLATSFQHFGIASSTVCGKIPAAVRNLCAPMYRGLFTVGCVDYGCFAGGVFRKPMP
jgi:hypothetical protein